MRRLYLATGNAGKLRDFAGLAGLEWLPGFAALPGIAETGATFAANARLKAGHYSGFTSELVVADDSGLVVDALDGAPGVHSARFAGKHGDDDANNALLLERLRGVPAARRTARFVCCLALARAGQIIRLFEGVAAGCILEAPRGAHGFGYDPVFYASEAGCAFAELTPAAKARYSHRGGATRALLTWLSENPDPTPSASPAS